MLMDTETIYYILAMCVCVVVITLLAALYFLQRSRAESKKAIKIALKEINQVATESGERIQKLDQRIVDSLLKLSPVAAENFSLAKQFLNIMGRRRDTIMDLLETRKLEDLFQAHKIATSPLENAGDHLSSVVFASTVLQLQPGQYKIAMDTMLNSVEDDLGGRPPMAQFRGIDATGHRRRKFTIRGFIQSVTGKEPNIK